MDRIQTATKAPNLFGAGKHGFRDGDLANGVIPTDLQAQWFNLVQEELANVVELAGFVLDGNARTQVKVAIDLMVRRQTGTATVATGTADAISAAFTPAVTALEAGMRVQVAAVNANATTTPTFKADGMAAKIITKGNNLPLVPGDIAGAGHWLSLTYDQGFDRWVLMNPATGVNAFGFGQSLTNVLASRALSTTYTNSTSRPIFVYVSAANTAGATPQSIALVVNGVTADSITVAATGSAASQELSVRSLVPVGGTYSVTATNSTLNRWFEQR